MKHEQRTISAHTLRAKPGPKKKIAGYAAVFNKDSVDMGFTERIVPGAFANALKASDVRVLFNHNPDRILGRTSAGTARLWEDRDGLAFECDLPKAQWADELHESIARGDVSQCSFGFTVAREEWSQDYQKRTILEVKEIFDVSPVTYPAYPDTTLQARNQLNQNSKIGDNMKYYSKENLRNLCQQRRNAQPGQIVAIENEIDAVATVLFRDCPTCAEAGFEAVDRFLNRKAEPAGGDYRPQPSDAQVGENRATQRPFKSLGEQLRAVRAAGTPGGQADPRLYAVRAASGLSEGMPSDGGFIVQTDYSNKLLANVWEKGAVTSRLNKVPCSSTGIRLYGFDETDRSNGSRAGGVQLYWESEADQYTGSKPKFREIELKPKKLIGLCYATDELLEDAPALESAIETAFTEEFDFVITDSVINGSGAGMPLGIRNSGCMVTQAIEDGQELVLVYENIVKMWSRMPSASRKNAVWHINQNLEPHLATMSLVIGDGGAPVYLPASGASGAPYGSLFGRPVIPLEQCQSAESVGDIMLCDWSKYVCADRGAMKKDFSIHVRFLYGEGVFRFTYRFDGQPMLASAITPANGTDTLSHFVALGSRA